MQRKNIFPGKKVNLTKPLISSDDESIKNVSGRLLSPWCHSDGCYLAFYLLGLLGLGKILLLNLPSNWHHRFALFASCASWVRPPITFIILVNQLSRRGAKNSRHLRALSVPNTLWPFAKQLLRQVITLKWNDAVAWNIVYSLSTSLL